MKEKIPGNTDTSIMIEVLKLTYVSSIYALRYVYVRMYCLRLLSFILKHMSVLCTL